VVEHFKVAILKGDILLLRTGYGGWYTTASATEKAEVVQKETFIGVEESMKSVKWLWNKHFAAVATDAPGLEVCPVPWGDSTKTILHE
jgi:kynurenine formamidase